LGEQLVHVVDVPGSLDLGHHDHVQLVTDLADQLGDVVEVPGGVQRIDPAPEPHAHACEIDRAPQLDRTGPSCILGVGGDGVFQVRQDHVDRLRDLTNLGPHLLQMRRDEVDHPLHPRRQLAQRLRRADGQRLEERAGGLLHRALR
jgi:hypothetical protein